MNLEAEISDRKKLSLEEYEEIHEKQAVSNPKHFLCN